VASCQLSSNNFAELTQVLISSIDNIPGAAEVKAVVLAAPPSPGQRVASVATTRALFGKGEGEAGPHHSG